MVSSPHTYNKVLLTNGVYTSDLTGKRLTIQAYVKALGAQQSIKIRIKSTTNGSVVYTPSEAIALSNGSLEGATYELV